MEVPWDRLGRNQLMKRVFSSTLIPLLLIFAVLLTGCRGDANQRKKKFLEIGNKAHTKGDYKAAAISYKKAIQEDNKFAEAYYRLGLNALKAGSYNDAIANLQRAFSLAPENSDAGSKLAEIFMLAVASDPKQGKKFINEIQDVTDRLLKRDPKSYDGLRLSAYLLAQDGKIEPALERYKQASAIKPDQPETVMPWALLMFQSHQDKDGEKLLSEFIPKHKDFAGAYDMLYTLYARDKRGEDAEKILRAKADAIPDHPEYRIQLAAHYYVTSRRADMDKELNTVATAGKDGQGHLLVGDFFMNLREFERAQKEFETGIQQGGKNKSTFQTRMVQLYAQQQKFAEAATLIDQVVKADPKNNEALGMRAALQVNTGDLAKIDAAITDLKTIVQRNPENFMMHYELGRAYLAKAQKTNEKSQVSLGRAELETTIKIRPDFALAKLLLAQLMIQNQEFSKAAITMDEVLANNPAMVEANLIRAVAWAGQKEYEKARTSLEGIIRTNPMQQDARFQLGEVYRAEGNFKSAEATFREFRKISPGDPRAWTGIAITLQDAKRYKEAESFLKDELAADPKREMARFRLADVYKADQQYDSAISEYQTLLKDHSKSSDLYAAIADTLRSKGDSKGAIDFFRKAVDLNPTSPGPMTALAMVLQDNNQDAESRGLYEKILKVESENVIALNNLAFIKAEEGTDIDGALTLATKAKQLAPNLDTISDTLGWIYIKKNLSDDAIRIFMELTRKDPNNPMYRYHLAQALIQKGDRPKAKKELDDALARLKSHPDSKPESQKYEKKIRELLPKVA